MVPGNFIQIVGKKTRKIVNEVGAVEPVNIVSGGGLISLRNTGNLCGKKLCEATYVRELRY